MTICLGCMEDFDEKYGICPYCGYKIGTSALEAYHMPPGTMLQNRYLVGRVIGYGGFGVTYIGLDTVLQKKVAIKEYLPGEFSTRVPGQTMLTIFPDEKEEQFKQGVKKFVDEARRLAKFQHEEHIVKIQDTFDENLTAYIVMEYLEGETLKTRLAHTGRMDVEAALHMIMPIAEALEQVHREGIIHRDISPDNIFITKENCVKLLDFGAARSATVGYSKSLSVIVKPGFAPTEQYRSRGEQGPWTDVYALAATFYQMITGEVPEDSMERAGKDELKPPSKLGVKISKGMENALMNALQIDWHDRTQNMQAFMRELKSEDTRLTTIKAKKEDTGRWTLPMKLGVTAGAAVLLILVALLATGAFSPGGPADRDYATVPDLTGMEFQVAAKTLSDMGMGLSQAAYSYSDSMAENLIVTQSIAVGSQAESGQTMEVILSLGKERRIIGDVIGFSPEARTAQLDGFTYHTSEGESELAPGTIVSVQTEQGEDIDLGTEIGIGNILDIVLSAGMDYDGGEQTNVPDLAGKDFQTARDLIVDSRLYIQKVELKSSDTVPEGFVISQDIEAGGTVACGTVISVVISSGEAPKVAIPNVLDKTEQEAKELLESVGLTVKISYEESALVAEGNVIRTSPQVNAQVEEGSEVELVVSSGRPGNTKKSNDSNKKKTEKKKTETEKKTTEEKKPPATEKANDDDDDAPATEQNKN